MRTIEETEKKMLDILFEIYPEGLRHIELRSQVTAVSSRDIVLALTSLVKKNLIIREEVNPRKVFFFLNLSQFKQHVLGRNSNTKQLLAKIIEKEGARK